MAPMLLLLLQATHAEFSSKFYIAIPLFPISLFRLMLIVERSHSVFVGFPLVLGLFLMPG